jgi:SAM-dependent methyltransferase
LFEKILDDQYRRPSGLLGTYIGARMARDHRPENLWTVSILQAAPADQILELGFGSGVAVQELSRRVTQGCVAGIDFSRAMLSAARRRNTAALRSGRVDLRYGDVADLPFEDGRFDKAYSIHSIYFWRQPLKALQNIMRVLKPGGMLVLTILPKERWNLDNPAAPVGTPDCTAYSGDELRGLLSDAGFSDIRIEADPNAALRSNYSVIGFKA